MSEYARVEIAQPELKDLADAIDDAPGDRLARSKLKTDLEGGTPLHGALPRASR